MPALHTIASINSINGRMSFWNCRKMNAHLYLRLLRLN